MQGKTKSFLEIISVFLAAALPLGQFFFAMLPESLTKLFLGSKFFAGASVVAAVLCLLLWLLLTLNPYFRIPWNLRQQWRYNRALRSSGDEDAGQPGTPRVSTKLPEPPTVYWSIDNTLLPAFIIATIAGLAFLYLGITAAEQKVESWVIFVQLVAYVFWVVSSFLILISYNVRRSVDSNFRFSDRERAQKAIARAIELNSFDDFPAVRFRGIESGSYPVAHIVYVDVGQKRYRIGCDATGEAISWVLAEAELAPQDQGVKDPR